ncbi:MAG: hypothetical protein KAJ10_01490 [Thermodesulfovibrionia bacterium]|nr:hypothetical protein [Thermodesulfovibrionia bacterium]
MKNNIIKLHRTSPDKLIEDLEDDFVELYAVGVKIDNNERHIYWYSSGNESRMQTVGVLEYLKFKLLEGD